MRYILSALMFSLTLMSGYRGPLIAAEVVVKPVKSSVALRNPLKGFRPDYPNTSSPFGTTFRSYVPWNQLEPAAIANDAIAIARIREYFDGTNPSMTKHDDFKNAANRGYRFIPRIYLVWAGSPDELYWPSDMKNYDFFSDSFIARMQNLVRRVGLALKDDPRLAAIEMGIHGKWGEHHLSDWDSKYPGEDTNSAVPNDFEPIYSTAFNNAFPDTLITRRYPKDFSLENYGYYWDSFAHPDLDKERDGIIASGGGVGWEKTLISGEVAYNWGGTNEYNGENPNDSVTDPLHYSRLEKYIYWTHATSLGWIANYSVNSATKKGAGILQDALGWRFTVTEARFSDRVEPGGSMNLKLSVRNDGSAPFYDTWPVGVALLDPATLAPVWRGVMSNVDVRTWMPGSDYNYNSGAYNNAAKIYNAESSINIPSMLAKGEYLLSIALLDPAGMLPNGCFAMANFVANGWQPIGRIGIGQSTSDLLNLPAFTDPNAKVPAYVFSRASLPSVSTVFSTQPVVVNNGEINMAISATAPDGGTLSVTYLVFGPAPATLSVNGAPIGTPVKIQFSQLGNYEIKAFVVNNNNGLSVKRTLNISVQGLSGSNASPSVSAGVDQNLSRLSGVTLDGTVSDDGLPIGSTLTATWTKISGPGAVTFASASSPKTTVSLSLAGNYVLRLSVHDGDLASSDDVRLSVTSGGGSASAPPKPAAPSVSDNGTATPTLTGTTEPNVSVHIFSDGKIIHSMVSGSDGKWTFILTSLPAGIHSITVQAENSAGKSPLSNSTSVTISTPPNGSAPDTSSNGNNGGGCGLGGLSASVWLALLLGMKFLRLNRFCP